MLIYNYSKSNIFSIIDELHLYNYKRANTKSEQNLQLIVYISHTLSFVDIINVHIG